MKTSWSCLIGEFDRDLLPKGCDAPLREAVQEAYYKLTGEWPNFTFSGWGAQPDKGQRAVINNTPLEETK